MPARQAQWTPILSRKCQRFRPVHLMFALTACVLWLAVTALHFLSVHPSIRNLLAVRNSSDYYGYLQQQQHHQQQQQATYNPLQRQQTEQSQQQQHKLHQDRHEQPCREGKVHFGMQTPCSSLPIGPATFLYMVMGAEFPKISWLYRSSWENISVLYTSWKVNISIRVQPLLGKSLRVTYYPNSTWTTGRNHQLQQAFKWEMEQRWKFEFFVYFDEDVYLSYRSVTDPSVVIIGDTDDYAIRLFNRNLVRDRPLRAGICFNDHPDKDNPGNWTDANFECVRRCQVDNLVLALHRTGVELLLPYNPKFDAGNWWASAYLQNLFTANLAARYCNYYREVLVERSRQVHSSYPRQVAAFIQTVPFMMQCLASSNYSDFATGNGADLFQRTRVGMGPQPEGEEQRCLQHPAGSDFAVILQQNLVNWPVTCL
eukprot:scpid68028/ scgid21820/ 